METISEAKPADLLKPLLIPKVFWAALILTILFNILILSDQLKFLSISKVILLPLSFFSVILLIYQAITLGRKMVVYHQGQNQDQKKVWETTGLLQQEKEKMEAILQSIQDGVIVTNIEGVITLASRKALEILKTAWVVIQDKSINELLLLSDQQLKELKEGREVKVQLRSLDGANIIVSIKTFPRRDEQGISKGDIYVLRDVTAEIEFEEMKLDFVVMAAHQLRTPLTALRGYLSLLERNSPGKLNDEEKLFLNRSVESSNRLSSLIENLLHSSRVEKGVLKLALKPVFLEEIVQEVVSSFIDNAKEKNIQLQVDKLLPPFSVIMGDKFLLGEALSNIITNGLDYNHSGGWVMVSVQKQPEGMAVHIADSGRGIPPSALNHLFTKFFRVSDSLTQLSSGAGLGLFISKSIIEAHRGKIWANSLEGKGTTISFLIPFKS